jgi:hypothetical protein
MQRITTMANCHVCFETWVDCRCTFANDNEPDGCVAIPTRDIILTRSYFHRLAIATANLNLSRRKVPDWMADALYRDDIIFTYHGKRVTFWDDAIERAFNHELGFRYISDLVMFAEHAPRQRPQGNVARRLQLIATSFWVHQPKIARHFAR